MERKSPEEFMKEISRFINSNGNTEFEEAAKQLQKEHRTLQQGLFRLFQYCLKEWAEMKKENRYDLRNEYAVTKSKEILDSVLNEGNAPLI